MSGLDVACFGELLWDIFEDAPREKEPISRHFRRELGGAPANVATGLARLGARASAVGGVGKDLFGDALLAHLAADGVDTRAVIRLPNRTGLTFVTRDARGEPSFLFYRHDSADLAVTAAHLRPRMARAAWVLVGTSTLMTPALAEATAEFLRLAKGARAEIFVDLNVRAHLWPDRATMESSIARLVSSAALVKGSDADLAALTGAKRGSRAAEARGRAWLEKHAPGASWLITRGEGLASAIGAHGEVSAPARRAKCVDATGAGDAFIAGSLAALFAGGAHPGSAAWREPRLWTEALEIGHMLGAKAVSRVGAVAGLVGLEAARARLERMRRQSRQAAEMRT